MNKRMLRLAFAMATGFPLLASAQQPGMACPIGMHGMMLGMMGGGPMRGQRGSEMDAMMSDSSMMGEMSTQLGLSDAQMQQLRAVHQRACAAAQPHMNMAMQAHQAAMQALQGDKPNLDHFEDQLEKAAKHMVEAQVGMAKGMIEFRKSLTPAQRQKLDEMHQQMMQHGMRPG